MHPVAGDTAAARRHNLGGIHVFTILLEAEIQMRAGGISGCAHIADDLPLPDPRPALGTGRKPGKMRIHGLQPAGMLENDHVPKTVPPPGLFDRAVADGLDRGSGGSRVIDALMRLMCFKNRMLAVHGIPRGNPRERQRSLQEGLFEAFALGVEEGFAVFRGEVIGFVRFSPDW